MAEITLPVSTIGPEATSSMPAARFGSPQGEGAGIVLVQEIFGRSAYMLQRAADLAALGYTVVVPQLYWRLGRDAVNEAVDNGLPEALGLVGEIDWNLAVSDVRDAVAALRRDPATGGRVALVGFCFGGGLAYASIQGAIGEQRADALVSYYGSALPGLIEGDPVTVPSLHHFGDSDSYISLDDVLRIKDAVTRNGGGQSGAQGTVEFHIWPGADHAFDNPAEMFHHREASNGAWDVTTAWLKDNFPA